LLKNEQVAHDNTSGPTTEEKMKDDCSCIEDAVCSIVEDIDVHWDEWVRSVCEVEEDCRCCECYEPLPKGTTAERIEGWRWVEDYDREDFGVEEVDPETVEVSWTCIPCSRIRDDLMGKSGCLVVGELRELIQECMGFDYVEGEDDEY
jgi:hypothetical protein